MTPDADELRWDPLRGGWVVIATTRGRRPSDFAPTVTPVASSAPSCPFCDLETAQPHVLAERAVGNDRITVVPNLYPALRIEPEPETRERGLYVARAATGAHEVIVESRFHDRLLEQATRDHLAALLEVWQARSRDLVGDRRLQHVQVFKNCGRQAGATKSHPHSQLIASSIRPARVMRELALATAHFTCHHECLSCAVIAQERDERTRLVFDAGGAVAVAPFASRQPFETWVLPTEHAASFRDASPSSLSAVAATLEAILGPLQAATARAGYNLVIVDAPTTDSFEHGRQGLEQLEASHHWRIELTPRVLPGAGYELATETPINPTPPEAAAAHLRMLIDRK